MKFNGKVLKRIFKVILVILIFICFSFTNGKTRKITVIEDTFNWFIYLPQKAIKYVDEIIQEDNTSQKEDELKKENEELKNQNRELQEKLALYSFLEQENRDLKIQLEARDAYNQRKVIMANIIAKTSNNWDEIYIIDKGSEDGVSPNNVVVTVDGLVGHVLTCGKNTSKILAILDATSTFSARASETREEVIVKGDILYKGENKAKIVSIPLDITYKSGDIFETSGVGGIYPKGIPVGKVEKYVIKPNPIENEAIISLFVDFDRIETVAVIIE